jgi:hypothetical protein
MYFAIPPIHNNWLVPRAIDVDLQDSIAVPDPVRSLKRIWMHASLVKFFFYCTLNKNSIIKQYWRIRDPRGKNNANADSRYRPDSSVAEPKLFSSGFHKILAPPQKEPAPAQTTAKKLSFFKLRKSYTFW